MNEITLLNRQPPDNIDDLSQYILIGRSALTAVKAKIKEIERVGLAKEVYEQKLAEAQEIAEVVLDAEVKMGELTAKIEKGSGGDRRSKDFKKDSDVPFEKQSKADQLKSIGITEKQKQRFETLAKHPEAVRKAKEQAREAGSIVTRQDALMIANPPRTTRQAVKDHQRKVEQEHEDFKEAKRDGVVSLEAARQDRANVRAIKDRLVQNIFRTTSQVSSLGFARSEAINESVGAMTDDERKRCVTRLEEASKLLLFIADKIRRAS